MHEIKKVFITNNPIVLFVQFIEMYHKVKHN